jgi:hypothetical protein
VVNEEDFSIAIELERLRGAINTNFAEMKGQLEGTLHRTGAVEAKTERLETRLALLERRVWTASGAAAAIGGAAGWLAQSLGA